LPVEVLVDVGGIPARVGELADNFESGVRGFLLCLAAVMSRVVGRQVVAGCGSRSSWVE